MMLLSLGYGNKLSFLDVTYKTTRYDCHYFFLLFFQNKCKLPDSCNFVCEGESIKNITEALNVSRTQNPSWFPMYFITDYSDGKTGK